VQRLFEESSTQLPLINTLLYVPLSLTLKNTTFCSRSVLMLLNSGNKVQLLTYKTSYSTVQRRPSLLTVM